MSARILVYGAGPLGSLLAARLRQGGNDVSLLARGQRLIDLREHGIVLRDAITRVESTTQVTIVEELGPDEAYDLILVVMRKNNVLDILPVLSANKATPNFLFLSNNAAGPGEYVKALGASRVLVGFPTAAGYRDGHVVTCLSGTEEKPYTIPFGELDGRTTPRATRIARILQTAPGFDAKIHADMDAWLKCHVALLMPSLAPAVYMCGTDNARLARTRDAIVLATRAIREGFQVLRSLGYPITPRWYRLFLWLPEPILVEILRKRMADPVMETALVRHAEAARDEVKHLTDEFLALARLSGVPIPSITRLYPHLDGDAPLMPAGSAEIPLRWRGLCVAASLVVSLILATLGTLLLLGPGTDRG